MMVYFPAIIIIQSKNFSQFHITNTSIMRNLSESLPHKTKMHNNISFKSRCFQTCLALQFCSRQLKTLLHSPLFLFLHLNYAINQRGESLEFEYLEFVTFISLCLSTNCHQRQVTYAIIPTSSMVTSKLRRSRPL